MKRARRSRILATALTVLAGFGTAHAAPTTAVFREVTYRGETAPAPAGHFRNPILPGFQPDPSLIRVGADFYLVNSTFAVFPGIPIYHSRDLVHWRLIGHALDRAGQVPLGKIRNTQGIYASSITHVPATAGQAGSGRFYIVSTCVGCGGNFMISATRPEGPWSDPVWLDFDGIDPSLFVDADGSAWIVNNGPPEGVPRYEGHRAIWSQRLDLASGRLFGPRRVLIDGGVHPADKPIWIEGPHLMRVGDWYYISAAEGGTAEGHSQTIWRARTPEGPFVAGPDNPILTQRDLPAGRPDRVEATGHAALVQLADGAWWAAFLGTRPYAGQSTLMGRETFLLPVRWADGWPQILPKGAPVPLVVRAPALPASMGDLRDVVSDRFAGPALSGEWLRLRSPVAERWSRTGAGGLVLTARADTPAGDGQPAFLGRRLRHARATMTARVHVAPGAPGDFAGLLAYADEANFTAFGLEAGSGGRLHLALRDRNGASQPVTGATVRTGALPAGLGRTRDVELRVSIDANRAGFAWRRPGEKAWHAFAQGVDVEHLATVHAGLFTGLLVGPYAQQAAR